MIIGSQFGLYPCNVEKDSQCIGIILLITRKQLRKRSLLQNAINEMEARSKKLHF